MKEESVRKNFNQIEKIYQTYLEKLLVLEKERDEIIDSLSQNLKNREIEHLKKTLNVA